MSVDKMTKMLLTHSSTAKQEEKQEERGSCQTLCQILNIKYSNELKKNCLIMHYKELK